MICNLNLTSALTFELNSLAQKVISMFLFFHIKGSEYRLVHKFREFTSSFPLFLDRCRITQMLMIVPQIGQVRCITLFISASWQLGKRKELNEFDEAKLWWNNWVRPSANLSFCWEFLSLEWSERNSSMPATGVSDHYWFGLADRQHNLSLNININVYWRYVYFI